MKHLILAIAVAIVVLIGSSIFTVREDQYAVLFRLGEIQRTDFEPGLHFKLPFVNNIIKFDRRILSLEGKPERFLTSEKKDVLVDSAVKWRIANVKDYYTATRGDELRAQQSLGQIVKDRMRDEFNKRTLQQVVADQRDEMMANLKKVSNVSAAALGIAIVDVRIKRIDLPEQVTGAVFDRMRSERAQVANALRSNGSQEGEQLRAEADRKIAVTLAEAERDAQRIRGEGDAQAAEIYAAAYNKDPEFYAFHRSLEAYRQSFKAQGNMLVLDPKSEFFEYFNKDKQP
ncbi:MAG: protease modulator HflC [Xanthomonadales bacterium]|nr:protease modulator HflC [Xanthomonadales bacterium]MCP5475907.1 protease modulator HflC [Rhodanobacteraceae bacterium]